MSLQGLAAARGHAAPARAGWLTPAALARIGLLVALFFAFDQFFAALAGIDEVRYRQAFSGLMLAAAAGYALALLAGGRGLWRPFVLWPAALLALYLLVSFASASMLLPKSIGDWLPAHYIFLPILSFYGLALLRFREREVVYGIVIAGLLAAAILSLDLVLKFEFMEYYFRRSIFGPDDRRVVLLNEEIVIAALFLYAMLWRRYASLMTPLMIGLALAVILVLEARVLQVRLAILATFFGGAFLTLWNRPQQSYGRMAVLMLLVLAGAASLPLLFAEYLGLLGAERILETNQYNVLIRVQALKFFWEQFVASYGIGVGMMSPTGTSNNVIGQGLVYGLNLSDLGLAAALLQFGVAGFLAVTGLTFYAIATFYRAFRVMPEPDRWRPASLAAFVAAGLISPVPHNLFSLYSAMFLGGAILFLVWRYRIIIERMEAAAGRAGARMP